MYKIIAHRGNIKGLTENSLAAIEACVEHRVDGVEFDIRHTSEGRPFVYHDEVLSRHLKGGRLDPETQKPIGPLISETTAAELSEKYRMSDGQKLAPLEAVLEILAPSNSLGVLELKDKPTAMTVALIQEAYRSYPEKLRLISFDHEVLRDLKKEPFFKNITMLALHEIPRTTWVPFSVAGLDGVNSNLIHPVHLYWLKARGLQTGLWWLGDKIHPRLMKLLFSHVDYLTTDRYEHYEALRR